MPDQPLPKQKELEKEIGDYLRHKYGDRIKIITSAIPVRPDPFNIPAGTPPTVQKGAFSFAVKPEELVAFLDEYVIEQDHAKDVLATKICTHFNRIRFQEEHPETTRSKICRVKSNLLLIGPTGVGKTFLVKLIAQRLGVPFVKGDATKFSETGYVGGDVEDLVRELVVQADGDIERAQYGIIYLDEVDKIAGSQYRFGTDVSRTGVQRALLKPMEETEVELKVPHDPISQLEAIEHYRVTGKREKRVLNTRNILFVMSGSFSGLDEIIRQRVHAKGIGFESRLAEKADSARLFSQIMADDLIQYGFESEFIGRLPVIVVLDELTAENLYEILKHVNSSVIIGKKQDFLAYGIKILFTDEALREISRQAVLEKTGARSLISVIERILLPFEKSLPSSDITRFVVTLEVVHALETHLDSLLHDPDYRLANEKLFGQHEKVELVRMGEYILAAKGAHLQEMGVALTPAIIALITGRCLETSSDPNDMVEEIIAQVGHIHHAAEQMSEKLGLVVQFADDAVDRLLQLDPCNTTTITQKCDAMYRVFEYGFRLIQQKKGLDTVKIPAAGVEEPERFIDSLVADHFKE